ncbi:MAG: ABC transporter permease subunit [Pseudomonadota bacterium]
MSVAASGPPQAAFRIDMLWTDERYRSLFIQVIAMMAIMLGFAWLVNNAIQNLEDLGQDFNFSFLWQPANYDINQRLIEYNSRDTNARAAVVGILNTLLVAAMGCITATVLGVIAGVLRLSKNWIVARLMTVYVEGFRNVPLLIWILFIMAIVNESLPSPRDFRGEDGLEAGAIVLTNRGFYVPAPVLENALAYVVIAVAILSIVGVFVLRAWSRNYQARTGELLPEFSTPLTFAIATMAGIAGGTVLGLILFGLLATVFVISSPLIFWPTLFISLVLGIGTARWAATSMLSALTIVVLIVPTVIVYFALGSPIALEYPELRGFNFRGGVWMRDSLIALWLALSLYTGAFIAEIVRAGIQSVSHGQTEAAYALGLRPNRTMNLIILPQALRVIVPPLISQYLNLTKNSSLAIAIGYMDATGTLGGITLNQTGRAMECILLLMAFYLIVSLTISSAMNWYNSRVKLVER